MSRRDIIVGDKAEAFTSICTFINKDLLFFHGERIRFRSWRNLEENQEITLAERMLPNGENI